MAGKDNLKPFVKGDKRINRKGRPKSFDALRALAQQIAHERATVGGEPSDKTIVEMILRSWAVSKNPQLQRAFVEIAFGKVPDALQVSNPPGETLRIEFIDIEHVPGQD